MSQRVDHLADRNETRDALDQRLIDFLLVAGFLPVPVPNAFHSNYNKNVQSQNLIDIWMDALNPQAFVLSGGNDIGHSIERDLTESWMLDFAEINRLPVLGICRGMQMMASWAGASLCPVKGHIRTRHYVSGSISGVVNSYHSYSIENCPKGFEVLASCDSGEIEAIRHKTLPWEGWMWHPEREDQFSTFDLQRVKVLFDG